MGVRTMNYLSLSPELRAKSAQEAKLEIQRLLNNPTLTDEQRASLNDRLIMLDKWANGTLHEDAPVASSVDESEAGQDG